MAEITATLTGSSAIAVRFNMTKPPSTIGGCDAASLSAKLCKVIDQQFDSGGVRRYTTADGFSAERESILDLIKAKRQLDSIAASQKAGSRRNYFRPGCV